MVTSINYLIATYGAKRTNPSCNQPLSEYVLSIQCRQLQQIFAAKKQQQIDNYISQITIIQPTLSAISEDMKYTHYYSSEMNEIEGVPVKYVSYTGANKHHSYDQYIEGYMAYPEFDYYFVMEDDYCMHTAATTFDHEFVRIYQETFPANTGYLCQMIASPPLHASISNGMISRESFVALGEDPLQSFFASGYDFGQLKFSNMWTRFSVDHQDTSKEHTITFFVTGDKTIVTFTPKTNPTLVKHQVIITCQEADIEHDYSTQLTAEECWNFSIPFIDIPILLSE